MEDEKVKTSQGILLIRTKSGTTKLEKVLVYAKRGKGKNQVKCRLQKYVKQKRTASRIPVFVRNYKRGIRSERIWKSLPSSVANIKKRNRVCDKSVGDTKNKYKHLNEEEKNNLMTIINLDNSKSDKFLQRQNEDSGIVSMSQTNASDKTSLSSELNQDLHKNEKVSLLSGEETESSRKNLSEDFSKSDTSSSKKQSREATTQETSTSAILLEEADSSQNKPITSDESPKIVTNEKEVLVAENQNYTIQFPLSDNDGEESSCHSHPQRQRTSIVMAQYQSTSESKPPLTEKNNEGDPSDDNAEEVKRYIDSGLRPLKSDESKLYLRPESHQHKKHHTTSEDDDIEPLLGNIPSDIFEEWDEPKKKKKKKPKKIIKPSTPSNKGDFTSSEDKSISSQPSNQIDTGPLKKLQDFEDVKFTIETEQIDEEEKEEDFCLHIEDIPYGDFSSSTVDDSKPTINIKEDEKLEDDICFCEDTPKPDIIAADVVHVEEKEEKSVIPKEDFCVHTTDPLGKDSVSTESSTSSTLSFTSSKQQTKIPHLKSKPSDRISKKDVKILHASKPSSLEEQEQEQKVSRAYAAPPLKKVKSASPSYSTETLVSHSIVLPSNKERRETKIKSMHKL